MPVGTLEPPLGRQVRTAIAATPPRLRPKGPLGPDFYRQSLTAKARPKQSAVERLEADKAKYVKSQVALSKQQPIRPPEMRKPLLTQSATLRPTRKTPARPISQHGGVPLNLEHLSNLINGVNDGPFSTTTVSSEESQPKSSGDCTTTTTTSSSTCPASTPAGVERVEERLCPPLCPDWSSPAKGRLKASGPTKAETPGCVGAPAAVTIRRVDVIPQSRPVRTPCRPHQYMRQPLQPIPLHSQFPFRPVTSNMRLLHPRTPGPSPLKSIPAPPHDHSPSCPVEASAPAHIPALPPPSIPLLPPSSPAITRLSSSSRKRPSLTRSKSDMSDRYSRAGTELERFFNLCGLNTSDLLELTGPGSDIVSFTHLRSASAPGSECAGSGRVDEDEEGGEVADRVPYGVSVIEKNARVIKWLYGIRHAKDNVKSTNL